MKKYKKCLLEMVHPASVWFETRLIFKCKCEKHININNVEDLDESRNNNQKRENKA